MTLNPNRRILWARVLLHHKPYGSKTIQTPFWRRFWWLFLLLVSYPAWAATFTNYQVLHAFGFTNQMADHPEALIVASDGAIYGLTSHGGAYENGALFKCNADGSTMPLLHSFRNAADDGKAPVTLVEAANGVLYGLTGLGGALNGGILFRINRDGSGFGILQSFARNGSDVEWNLEGSLIAASDGVLYGTTCDGGSHNQGTVFKANLDRAGIEILYNFNQAAGEGVGPRGLVEGSDGLLYGVASSGGNAGGGSLFKLQKDGRGFSVLFNFAGTNGSTPFAPLLEGSDGLLYGTTRDGGTYNQGTIFCIQKDGGTFARLHDFEDANGDGRWPTTPLLESANGLLYGVTYYGGSPNSGTLYSLNKDGTGYAVTHGFQRPKEGLGACALVQAKSGALYGLCWYGGNFDDGILFKFDPGTEVYAVVYHFSGTGLDGEHAQAGLLEASDGKLYGTTVDGGRWGTGTLFSLNKDGTDYAILHSFDRLLGEGCHPQAELVQGSDGLLYGTTSGEEGEDCGTLFKLGRDGSSFVVLHRFAGADGSYPHAALREGSDGLLYGTTYRGGAYDCGTVFRLKPDGTGYTVLHEFNLSGGAAVYSPVVQGTDGWLYGTTSGGGNSGNGTVFKLNTNGSGFTILHRFTGSAGDGKSPMAGVIEGSDGRLYGTTDYGGAYNYYGTIFRVNKDGTGYTVLYSFNSDSGGYWPYAALREAGDGTLWGTASGGGSMYAGMIFQLNKDGTGYAVRHGFGSNADDGQYPRSSVLQGSDGAYYGTTPNGGLPYGGVVFRLGADSPTLTISSLPRRTSAGWLFSGCGRSGKNCFIQAAASLAPADWSTIGTVTTSTPDGIWQFEDAATAPVRFYRAVYR